MLITSLLSLLCLKQFLAAYDLYEPVSRVLAINISIGKKEQSLKIVEATYSQQTAQIQDIDEDKATTLREAKFPVDELSFDEDGIIYHGSPFSVASRAGQIRVSMAIGFSFNPRY